MMTNSRSEEIIALLREKADPSRLQGMARYGINTSHAIGNSIPEVRQTAKVIGKDHALAEELWQSAFHEARILASLVDQARLVEENQMERWVADFDSWDLCDQVCSNLFDRTPYAWLKAIEWSQRSEEYVRRAGFVLMACLATHDKRAAGLQFEPFFPLMISGATDERNFVKKAVNWALRGVGKRNLTLNQRAIQVAQEMQQIDSRTARWIAADALRELTNADLQAKLAKKSYR